MKPRTRRKPCIHCGKPSRRHSKRTQEINHTTGKVWILNVIYECNKGCGAFWIRYFGPEKSALGSAYSLELVYRFIKHVMNHPEITISRMRAMFNFVYSLKISVSTAHEWFYLFASDDQKRTRAKYREF